MDFHAITDGTNFSAINPYAESMNKFLQESNYNVFTTAVSRINGNITFVKTQHLFFNF
jgi:hypothetical protein